MTDKTANRWAFAIASLPFLALSFWAFGKDMTLNEPATLWGGFSMCCVGALVARFKEGRDKGEL